MEIKELQTGQGNVEVEATIKELEETKEFDKYGRKLRLRSAVIEDSSGSMKLTLWNDDVDKYNVGDKILVKNGYVNEFQGEKQLTSGKLGTIEKAGQGDTTEKTDSSTTAEEPEEAAGLPDSSNEAVVAEEVASEEKVEEMQEAKQE